MKTGKKSKILPLILMFFVDTIGFAIIFFFIDGFTLKGFFHGLKFGAILYISIVGSIVILAKLLSILFGTKIKDIQNKIKEEIENDKTLIYAGMVSYSKGSSRISGIMRLSEKTLYIRTNRDEETPYIRTNRPDIEEQETYIPVDTIAIIKKYNEVFFNPTGLLIVTMDGCKRKFSLNDRDIWFEKITEAMEKNKCHLE